MDRPQALAGVRWLQVAALLPAARVHRYCHFGYVHAAAAAAAFDCWQEPWVGSDCPTPLCDHRHRATSRLLDPATAALALAAPVDPAREQLLSLSLSAPPGCVFPPPRARAGARARAARSAVRFRALWLGAASRGARREVALVEGDTDADGGAGGDDAAGGGGAVTVTVQVRVTPETRGRGGLAAEQEAALVVEVRAAYDCARAGNGSSAGARESSSQLSRHIEDTLVVFPAAAGAAAPAGAAAVRLRGSWALGAGGGDAAAEEAWADAVRWALLAEEYYSRHLAGRAPPQHVLAAAAVAPPLALPLAARTAAVHLVVLAVLEEPGALERLERHAARWAARRVTDPLRATAWLVPRVSRAGGVDYALLAPEDAAAGRYGVAGG